MLDYLRILLDARLAKMDERGASAVEYGLLIAGIAALIVVVVFAFGGVIKNIFSDTCNSVGQAAPAAAAPADLSNLERPRTRTGPRPFSCHCLRCRQAMQTMPRDRTRDRPSSARWLVRSDHITSGDRLYLRATVAHHTLNVITAPAFQGATTMLDYLRILLDARLAKMDERGASAVEYGLLIAGIAALIVVVVFAFGGVLNNIFDATCNSGRHLGRRRHLPLTSLSPDRGWPRTHGDRGHRRLSPVLARPTGRPAAGPAAGRSRSARASWGVTRTRTVTRPVAGR